MKSALSALWGAAKLDASRAFRQAGWAQYAVAAVYVFVLLDVAAGAFLLFLRGFQILLEDPVGGSVLVRYVMEASFLAVAVLGVASAAVASGRWLFKEAAVEFIAPLPVTLETRFTFRFIGLALMSSWPVLLVAMPALAALGVAAGGGEPLGLSGLSVLAGSFYAWPLLPFALPVLTLIAAVSGIGLAHAVFSFAALLLLLTGISFAGAILSFAFAPFIRRISPGLLGLFESIGFVAVGVMLARRLVPHGLGDSLASTTPDEAVHASQYVDRLFGWFPTHPLARAAASAVGGEASPVADLALAALLIALAAVLLAVLVRWAYAPLLARASESGFLARSEDAPARRLLPFPRLLRWRHGFLFERQFLEFVRSPDDISRAASLCLILALYVFGMRAMAGMDLVGSAVMYARVVAFAVAATGYVAVTLAMRFAFPAPGAESRRAWIVRASPLHPHELYSWQFFFWASGIGFVAGVGGLLTAWSFGFAAPLAIFVVGACLTVGVTVTAVALGQGTVFPARDVRDPDAASTSPAGIAAVVIASLYLTVTYGYVRTYAENFLNRGVVDGTAVAGILTLSSAIVAGYWGWAVHAIENRTD